MIVPKGPRLSNMMGYVGKPLLLLLIYDLAVVTVYKLFHWTWIAMPHIPLSLFGSAIGIILAFRNQSAYARWWEARTLWGAVVNHSRSWTRQVTTAMMPVSEAEAGELKAMQKRMVYHQIAYVIALRQSLRRLEPWEELAPLLSEQELMTLRDSKNVPLSIQQQMGMLLRVSQMKGWIDIAQWRAMDASLSDLMNAQGRRGADEKHSHAEAVRLFPEAVCADLLHCAATGPGAQYGMADAGGIDAGGIYFSGAG